jgi:hypothetical protein
MKSAGEPDVSVQVVKRSQEFRGRVHVGHGHGEHLDHWCVVPDEPNVVGAVPEPNRIVTVVVGQDLVDAEESLQEGLDVGAGICCPT